MAASSTPSKMKDPKRPTVRSGVAIVSAYLLTFVLGALAWALILWTLW